jgi:glucose/arabinose dehydrogenase
MNKKIYILIFLILICGTGWYLFEQKIGTVSVPSKVELPSEDTDGSTPLSGFDVPAGFEMSIFAKGVDGARVLAVDPKGRMIVSQTSVGQIVLLLDEDNDNVSDGQKVLATGLKKPHGMAFECNAVRNPECHLYVAEADALVRFNYDAETMTLDGKEKVMSINYSATDRHFTRSLLFMPSPNENTLLISVGSSCDVCDEKNPDQASIISYNIKTGASSKETYAKGLRNAPFMTLHPVSGEVYATEMGRDGLGDDIPPDEINIIKKGQNYGWPVCYGKNIHDTNFDKKTYIRNPCMEPFETESFIDLQAHSAPLGLAFIPEEGWNEDMWYNMLVAYHGSWNRSTPTGYKIARIKMDANGKYLGMEDFITGWLTEEGKKTGRPVDIKAFPGGTIYITDDSAGVVYRVAKK